MSSLTEIFAAILLWLSAMALCQFGVVVERPASKAPAKAERVVARSPRQQAIQSTSACPHRPTVAVSA